MRALTVYLPGGSGPTRCVVKSRPFFCSMSISSERPYIPPASWPAESSTLTAACTLLPSVSCTVTSSSVPPCSTSLTVFDSPSPSLTRAPSALARTSRRELKLYSPGAKPP